jgi:hypothetical protein
MIEQALFQESDGGANPTSPHELKYVVITAQVAATLNEKWHSRLPIIHWSNILRNKNSLCFGIIYESNYIGCAIWSSPVSRAFDDVQVLELRRMALSDKCPKNTATRFISYMTKYIKKSLPEIALLISYQDTDVHKGIIYKASNWQAIGHTKFQTWSHSRLRNPDQSTANKIRWEYQIKPMELRVKKIKPNQLMIGDLDG